MANKFLIIFIGFKPHILQNYRFINGKLSYESLKNSKTCRYLCRYKTIYSVSCGEEGIEIELFWAGFD